jgi:Domain of unknown function (DUF3597)
MSLFSSILSKLGFGSAEAAPIPPAALDVSIGTPAPSAPPTAAAPAAVAVVDVVAKLESLAASHSEKLNWKTSIVDLMKLLGMESSLGVRKELAAELGCPAEKMADSASMNMWLHKTVLQKIAENGGNVPASMLD